MLAVTLLLTLVLAQLVALAVGAVTEPAMTLFGQHRDLVPLVGDYMKVRLYGAGMAMLYIALREALKVCGAKNRSLVALIVGLGANALLNWAFLYTGLARFFSSPESAVAASTLIAQTLSPGGRAWMFVIRMRARGDRFARPTRAAVWGSTGPYRTGVGVGARDVNDYMGSIVPMMFIGTMGVRTLAASVIAVNIYSAFCRVPQACFQATFVYYGYAVGTERSRPGQHDTNAAELFGRPDGGGRATWLCRLRRGWWRRSLAPASIAAWPSSS